MTNKESKAKVANAVRAMRAIGIPRDKVKPVLKDLLKLFDKNWAYIEAENYRALADAIFKRAEPEAADHSKKTVHNENKDCMDEEAQAAKEELDRPLKRLRQKYKDGQGSPLNAPEKSSVPKMPLITPKEEPSDLPRDHLNQSSGSPSHPTSLRDGRKGFVSPQTTLSLEKSTVPKTEPNVESPDILTPERNSVIAIHASKDEPITDDMALMAVPIAVIHSAPRKGVKKVASQQAAYISNHEKQIIPIQTTPAVEVREDFPQRPNSMSNANEEVAAEDRDFVEMITEGSKRKGSTTKGVRLQGSALAGGGTSIPSDAKSKISKSKGKQPVEDNTQPKQKKQRVADQAENIEYTTLKTRNSAENMVHAFKEMNEAQRKDVIDMGFGRLAELEVTELPTTLCYWLLDNFDPKSCEIKLQEGRRLHVEADDVSIVLGLPSGPNPIQRKAKNKPNKTVDEWRGFYPPDKKNVTTKMVIKTMFEHETGGLWFKRMFLILMTTCLIEGLGNGYVSTQIVGNFEDVDKARELDWGEYVIRCLVEQTDLWKKNKEKNKETFYTGPILFLLGLYVDRVVLYRRFVPRAYPSLKGWTCTLLRRREKDEMRSRGFGFGYPTDRYKLTEGESQHRNGEDHHATATADGPEPTHDQAACNKGDKTVGDAQKFAENFLKKVELMTGTMLEIITMAQSVPVNLMNNIHFEKVIDMTERLLGCKLPTPSVESTSDAVEGSNTQADDDQFWVNPNTLTTIDAIEKAILRRDEFKMKQ